MNENLVNKISNRGEVRFFIANTPQINDNGTEVNLTDMRIPDEMFHKVEHIVEHLLEHPRGSSTESLGGGLYLKATRR